MPRPGPGTPPRELRKPFESRTNRVGRGRPLVDEEDFLRGIDAVLDLVADIDPDRIGVAGGSYGGYVTNWLTARSDRFAAAVTSRSIVSLETLYGTSESLEYHFFGPDAPTRTDAGEGSSSR